MITTGEILLFNYTLGDYYYESLNQHGFGLLILENTKASISLLNSNPWWIGHDLIPIILVKAKFWTSYSY